MAMLKADVLAFIPQVLAGGIVTGLKEEFDFNQAKIITVIDRDDMVPGRTLDIPIRGQVGRLQVKAEGDAMAKSSFATSKIQITPTVKALEVEFSLEAQAYQGDLAQDITNALVYSMADTLDNDIFERVDTISNANDIDNSSTLINFDDLSSVFTTMKISKFNTYTLFVAWEQLNTLRTLKDANGNPVWADVNLADIQITGQVGYIFGVKVVATDKIVEKTGTFHNYVVEDGAVGLVWTNRKMNLDSDYNKHTLMYSVMLDTVYETFVMPNKSIQRVIFKK